MFRTRNSYYLRISKDNVLPIFVYLDDRHVAWMSPNVLNAVLSDLRPMILPKLKAETDAGGPSSSKNVAKVDVHRGDNYQFCYFIREVEPHSVLIKRRTFVAAPPVVHKPQPTKKAPAAVKKRKAAPTVSNSRKGKKRKTKGKGKATEYSDDDDDEVFVVSSDDEDEPTPGPPLRRSGRMKQSAPRNGTDAEIGIIDAPSEDVEMGEPAINHTVVKEEETEISPADLGASSNVIESMPTHIDLEIEDEEAKPKPLLQLKYQGFNIYGHCLCIVVEPWPGLLAAGRAQSVAPGPSIPARSQTPLFLPEEEEESELVVPRKLPRVPLFNDPLLDDSEDELMGMMELSQVLAQAAGEFISGGMEEEEEQNDGTGFFGDADEIQEL